MANLGKEWDNKANFLGVVAYFRRDEAQDDEVFQGCGVVLGDEVDNVFQQGVALLLGHLQKKKAADVAEGTEERMESRVFGEKAEVSERNEDP